MISGERLQEIERLANAATPGPWKNDVRVGSLAIYPSSNDVHCFGDNTHIICKINGKYYNDQWNMADQQMADGDFIAAARTAIPDLIAHIRELEAEREDASYGKMSRMFLAELTKRQRLEKEADWLAEQLHKIDVALHGEGVQKLCWREIAKGAVALAAKQKEQEQEEDQ